MTNAQIDAVNRRVWESYEDDVKRSLSESLKARRAAERIGYQAGVACALRNIGVCHSILLDFDSAFPALFKALELFRALNQVDEVATVLNALGRIHFRMNDYERALEYYSENLCLRH